LLPSEEKSCARLLKTPREKAVHRHLPKRARFDFSDRFGAVRTIGKFLDETVDGLREACGTEFRNVARR